MNDTFDNQFCTGTLIAPCAVLTSAYCANGLGGTPEWVVTGRYDISDAGTGGVRRTISNVLYRLNPQNENYDTSLALIFLRECEEDIKPIALNCNHDIPKNGEEMQVIGYGDTSDTIDPVFPNVPNGADVNYITNQECIETLETGLPIDPGDLGFGTLFVTPNTMCSVAENAGPCLNDDGM